jgi:hypothetical protein
MKYNLLTRIIILKTIWLENYITATSWTSIVYDAYEIPSLGCGGCILAGLAYTSNT